MKVEIKEIEENPQAFRPLTLIIKIETLKELAELVGVLGDTSGFYEELYLPLKGYLRISKKPNP